MKFEIRYSRKIRDAVAVFTIFMFICQYGLTREDVAENFSRTAPTWGWFALDKPDWEFWNEKLKESINDANHNGPEKPLIGVERKADQG